MCAGSAGSLHILRWWPHVSSTQVCLHCCLCVHCCVVSEAAVSSSKSWLQPRSAHHPGCRPALLSLFSSRKHSRTHAPFLPRCRVGFCGNRQVEDAGPPQVTYRVRQCVGPDTPVVAGSPGQGNFRSRHCRAVAMSRCEKIPRRLYSHRSRSDQHVLGAKIQTGSRDDRRCPSHSTFLCAVIVPPSPCHHASTAP